MTTDCLILGSSPNALVAAQLLKRAGMSVLVAEPGPAPGGVARHLPSLRIDPAVVEELQLDLSPAGSPVRPLGAELSAPEGFLTLLRQASELTRQSFDAPPVDAWRALGRRQSMEVLRLPWMSLRDLLLEWFEDEPARGFWAALGVRGIGQGPYASGTVFNLLHQWACGEGLERFAPGPALEELAKGLEIRTGTPVEAVELNSEGRAVGARLGGNRVEAEFVLSDFDARHTMHRLLSPRDHEPEFNRELTRYRYQGCVCLAELECEKTPGEGTWVFCPGLAWLEKAYDPVKYGGVSEHPLMEVSVRAGQVTCWSQYGAAPEAKVLAPWFGRVTVRSLRTPADLERECGLSEGHLQGGDSVLHQSYDLRFGPRTPVDNLLLCGAAVHPGGHCGLAGRRAARAVLTAAPAGRV